MRRCCSSGTVVACSAVSACGTVAACGDVAACGAVADRVLLRRAVLSRRPESCWLRTALNSNSNSKASLKSEYVFPYPSNGGRKRPIAAVFPSLQPPAECRRPLSLSVLQTFKRSSQGANCRSLLFSLCASNVQTKKTEVSLCFNKGRRWTVNDGLFAS